MTQTTLLTSHKGVDLHAATAVRVMQRRLEGGDALQALYRCEMHTFWGEGDGRAVPELLEIGRFYNPNKHHYGHFETSDGPGWLDSTGWLGPAGSECSWHGVVCDPDESHVVNLRLGIVDWERRGLPVVR